jgi:hypothetical protein
MAEQRIEVAILPLLANKIVRGLIIVVHHLLGFTFTDNHPEDLHREHIHSTQ